MITVTQAPAAEAQTIARAQAALAAVRSDTFPTPPEGGPLIQHYADWLAEDLTVYARLLTDPADPDYAHPADMYPELSRRWPHDALGQAAGKAVEDISYGTGALAEIVRRFCGDETAEFVLGAAQAAQEGEK